MRPKALLTLCTLVAAACGDSTGTDLTLDGEWTVSLRYGVPSPEISCTEGGSFRLSQSGNEVTGTYSTVAACTVAGAASTRPASGTLSGRIDGSSVSFVVDRGCTIHGRLEVRQQMSGELACPLELEGQELQASGTWDAVWVPRQRDLPPG